MINPMHSSESNEHYTPYEIVEAARRVLGAIDLDPASCALANRRVVKALAYLNISANGLSTHWGGPHPMRVFCNPPGGRTSDGNKSVQKLWWAHGVQEWLSGRVDAMVWVAFKVDFLQTTQVQQAACIPLDFPICYPRERVDYLTSTLPGPTPKNQDRKPTKRQSDDYARTGLCCGGAPPHASAIIYLPSRDPEGITRFVREFSPIGAVRWDPRVLPKRELSVVEAA